ncbi:TadG family pilus assembly protein [Burkholderia stagnalis]
MLAAIWILVAILVLCSIDIGNLYFQRRDVQRVADMAALAAAQRIDQTDTSCATAKSNALKSAGANNSNQVSANAPSSGHDQVTTTCGRWDPPTATATSLPPPNYYVSPTNVFPINAAQVTVTRSMTYFFMGLFTAVGAAPPTISANATARATNIDSFSVSSGVLSVGGSCASGSAPTGSVGLLDILLSGLLGSGSQLNLSVGCYNALASANIKLGDLATALNVGTPKGLVNTTVKLSDLLNASVAALNANAAANVNVAAANTALSLIINSLNVAIGNTLVTVINPNQAGSSLAQSGAISLGVPPGQNPGILANAATQATVDLLDLVMAAAAIANAQSAAMVSLSTSQLAALGFPANLVNLQIQILTPPSPAVGEAGKLNGQYRTQATNGQIGVSLTVGLPQINLLGLFTLGGLNLPLYLVVGGPSTANLETIDCEASTSANPSWVTISVTPNIASVCVGNAPTTASGWLNLASNNSCSGTASSVSASLLGLSVVNLNVSSSAPIITLGAGSGSSGSSGSSSPAFYSNNASPRQFCVESDASQNCPTYWTTNSNALGSQIINLNSLSVGPLVLLGIINLPIQVLTPLVAPVLQGVLNLVVPLLNSILVPVLNLLGAQIGQATVHQIGLTCGTPQLVY